MGRITYSRVIAATPNKVYVASQYYPGEWDPFSCHPRGAPLEQRTVVGQRAHIIAWHGLSMDVEYIQVQAPERAAMKMVSGPSFLASFAGSWRFLPYEDGKTLAHFKYHLRAANAYRWLEPLMRLYFAWETRRRLNALADYCEHSTITYQNQGV